MGHLTTFANHGTMKQDVEVKFFDNFIVLTIQTEHDYFTHHMNFDQLLKLEKAVTDAVQGHLEAVALAEFDARREDGEYAID